MGSLRWGSMWLSRVLPGVKIARQACHQIARAVIVIKLHVLMLNLRKQKISNAVEHILRYALKIDAGRIHDNSTQKCYQYHPHNQFDDCREFFADVCGGGVFFLYGLAAGAFPACDRTVYFYHHRVFSIVSCPLIRKIPPTKSRTTGRRFAKVSTYG